MANQINRNFVWCNEYSDGSFLGIFHEKLCWDDGEYFKLEDALYEQCQVHAGSDHIPRELSWRVMRIFSFLMMSLSCQYDKNDNFKIGNLTRDQYYGRRERLQLVFEGFFKGEMPDKEILISASYR